MNKSKQFKKLIEIQNKKLFQQLEMQSESNKYMIEAMIENQVHNYFMMKTIIDNDKLLKK